MQDSWPIDKDGYWIDDSSSSSSCGQFRPWSSWEEVPDEVPQWAKDSFIFLEVFAGTAGITEAVHSRSCVVMPPIDIDTSEAVKTATDIVDTNLVRRSRLLRRVCLGCFWRLCLGCLRRLCLGCLRRLWLLLGLFLRLLRLSLWRLFFGLLFTFFGIGFSLS